MKEQIAIEWPELLQLLEQFTKSPLVKSITAADNASARMCNMTPEEHVNIDIFVYYKTDAPSSEEQKQIARGFVGDVGERKVWDGLNVSNAWDDPTARLYNCLLYFPKDMDKKTNMPEDFKKIGFPYESTSSFGSQRYTWESVDGKK